MKYNKDSNSTNPLLVESAPRPTKVKSNKLSSIWIIIICILILLTIIAIIIYFTVFDEDESDSATRDNKYYESKLLEIPSNDSCYNYSQILAAKPHIAGEAEMFELGQIVGDIFQDLGYEVYYDNISGIVLDHFIDSSLSINNIPIDISNDIIADDSDTNTSFRHWAWNPFSSSGNHTGQLIYINNAAESDFQFLINEFGINFQDADYIGFAKRGNRANQAQRAGEYGLKSLIWFENMDNSEDEQYPNGPKLPETGFQYGRIRFSAGCLGNVNPNRLEDQCGYDTSNYWDLFPAIKYNLSAITISTRSAIQLFDIMNEFYIVARCNSTLYNVPTSWQTNLRDTNICIGGTNEVMVDLMTNNDFHANDTIQNVYAYYEGEEYPDEIIMIGAHRDAHGFGACDDISGTVTMIEIARALTVLREDYGWKPKRSLMFGSWDGEEWNLYGSVDFNERFNNEWIDQIVTYINFDMTVVGGGLSIQGNPLWRSFLLDTAKMVEYPYPELSIFNKNPDNNTLNNFTLYDTWFDFDEGAPNDLPLTAANSDFAAFEYYSGIPSTGAGFWSNTHGAQAYTYHTFYDLNGWLDVVDPQWFYARNIAIYGGLLMLKLSQQNVLPLDIIRLAAKMYEWTQLDLPTYARQNNCSVQLNDLVEVVIQFENATSVFNEYLLSLIEDTDSDHDTYQDINDILMNLMRMFTLKYPHGVPSNKWYKQLIFHPNKRFPFIWDVIADGCNQEQLILAINITTSVIRDGIQALLSVDNVS